MNTSIGIRGVNHVSLRVRDLEASVAFYERVLGFTEDVERFGHGVIAFLRAPQSNNHHDLALLKIGPNGADDSPHSVGMHHFALEVGSIEDLVTGSDRLAAEGCLDGAADHGATKAVYGRDPDNNIVELTWVLPRAEWADFETAAPIKQPLDVRDEANRRQRTPDAIVAVSNA